MQKSSNENYVESQHETNNKSLSADYRLALYQHKPGAQSTSTQSQEHGANEFAEGGWVHGVKVLLLAMSQVMVVQGAAWQADSF